MSIGFFMGERSHLLYRIELALEERGVECRLGSIPDLRAALPGIEGALGNDRLSELVEEIRSGCDLSPMLCHTPQKKCTLTRREIRLRYIKGESVRSIALDAGVTVKRVYALIGNAKTIDRMRKRGVQEKDLIRYFRD
jgi:hypothetical protein